MKRNTKTLFLAQFGILLALEVIVCFTPLGSIPIGPIVATLMMVPVCITAILLGTKAGTLMGFFSGLFSFIIMTFAPPSPATAFIFTPFYSLGDFHGNFGSLLICFVPRTLTGTVAGLVSSRMNKFAPQKEILNYSLSSILGSLTNTIGVMLGIAIFFGPQLESILQQSIFIYIGTTILTSGVAEAIVCAIASSAVCKPVKKMLKNAR